MQDSQRSLLGELKFQLKFGSMTHRLLLINLFVFIVIHLINTIIRLSLLEEPFFLQFNRNIFCLETELSQFLLKPWGLFTSIFSHIEFLHFVQNMLVLYFIGKIYEGLFDKRKLWLTYLFGGIFGGIFELGAHLLFPALQENSTVIIGASGSIMAILSALACFSPNLKLTLFGVLPVPIFVIAVLFWLVDLVGLSTGDDHIAHFSHLGGAIFGFWSVQRLNSPKNILTMIQRWWTSFKQLFKANPKKSGRKSTMKTDEDYAYERRKKQERTDKILDKIAKSGYDSLTKEEKDFLFNQSKNG
ncbi:MAG: rhomboid family intramembrane serine protease [Bacteroidetes bacterium]|nr:rhomboid family intramembrane serine protease [Bacteroidota bacterium]